MQSVFSLRGLAWCWAGLLATLGVGAVALQVTTPPPPPVVVAAIAPTPLPPPEPVAEAVVPPSLAMPFQNSSLAALMPPVVHAIPHVAAKPLPVPPMPPPHRLARVEPRRIAPSYAAAGPVPPYEQVVWPRGLRYPAYARFQPYDYAPPQYYGW